MEAFHVDRRQITWVQAFYFIGYSGGAILSRWLVSRLGCLAALRAGLTAVLCGCVVQIAICLGRPNTFQVALATVVVAVGLGVLEATSSPILIRLDFGSRHPHWFFWSQAFVSLAALGVTAIGVVFAMQVQSASSLRLGRILSLAPEALVGVAVVFVCLAFLSLSIMLATFFFAFFRETGLGLCWPRPDRLGKEAASSLRLRSIAACFLYYGGQICCWSFFIQYTLQVLLCGSLTAAELLLVGYGLFAVGRMVLAILASTRYFSRIRTACAVATALCILAAIYERNSIGVGCLIVCNVFMSILYPSLYRSGIPSAGRALRDGPMLTAMIIAGALLPALQAWISATWQSYALGMGTAAACFVGVALASFELKPTGAERSDQTAS